MLVAIWLLVFVILRSIVADRFPGIASEHLEPHRSDIGSAAGATLDQTPNISGRILAPNEESLVLPERPDKPTVTSVELRLVISCGKWLNERLPGQTKWGGDMVARISVRICYGFRKQLLERY